MLNQNNGLFGDIQGAQRSTVGGMMPTKPNIPAPSPLFPTNSGIVPPGPKQHNLDDPGGGGGPMGFPGGDDGRGFGGGGPMPFPPGGNILSGGMGTPMGATPYHYTQTDMNWGRPQLQSAPGSRLYSANGRPPTPNPWGQGNDPMNVNGPGGPHSYGNPEGTDGRGFGGGGPMPFPGHDDRGPGGGPMPFPPSGPMGNAPGGPWGGNPNSYGQEDTTPKGFGGNWSYGKGPGASFPQENQMQPMGMRDRQGPWSRRLGQAPQGPGLFNPQPQESPQQQMSPWLRNYLIQRRGL